MKAIPPPQDRCTRVLIVDDHPAICEALAQMINDQPDMEVCAATVLGHEALALAQEMRPDVAIIDLVLKDWHGLDLTQSIATTVADTAIVVYSMHDERVYAERALRAGARGYVMKSEPTRSVVDAIRRVRHGEVSLSSEIASHILSSIALGARQKSTSSLDKLTDRELMVFQMIGEGRSAADIGDELGLNRKTIETYRRRIRQKLGFESNMELLQFAFHYKYGQNPHN